MTKDEYKKAREKIKELDKKNPEYNLVFYNCDDFVNDIVHGAGIDKGTEEFFDEKQKDKVRASLYSDRKKYMELKKYRATEGSIPDLIDKEERKLGKEKKKNQIIKPML